MTLSLGSDAVTTRGIAIPVGMSKTVEVDLYSDAPTADWSVEAIDVASRLNMTSPELAFSFDKSTGNNGDKLQLTITRLKAPAERGVSELGLGSQVNGITIGTWWALVSQ